MARTVADEISELVAELQVGARRRRNTHRQINWPANAAAIMSGPAQAKLGALSLATFDAVNCGRWPIRLIKAD